ncbi:MAG TPA: SDR family NAD(P)-dependent oxidoreductase [Croceibacterium sp.]|nr:SDR family NAD(P)-dependent oxidoreductase [Croceibacterium sp.]
MAHLFIFGLGYSAKYIANAASQRGWLVTATGRDGALDFDDEQGVRTALGVASHVLSSVPPGEAGDPVLSRYGDVLDHPWLGYLSSTGVYGDTGGAWVDETAPVGGGRRHARAEADTAWLNRGARVFRLPGIYGPGRSAIERVAERRAHRIDLPQQVFSRVHVDDIAAGVIAGLDGPPGAYNLADDLPASQNAVIEEACRLSGQPLPPLLSLEEAKLSPQALAFYAENRRVANGKARRLLGWRPRHATYHDGLRACLLSARSCPAAR